MRRLLVKAVLAGLLLVLSACATNTPQAALDSGATNPATSNETSLDESPSTAAVPTTVVAEEVEQTAQPEDVTESSGPVITDWQAMPVIPAISARTIDIYQTGLEMGNSPNSFSVLGECQSELAWEVQGITVQGYLSGFDEPANYNLGADYGYLQETIDNFAPAWTMPRVAAHRGTNVAQVLSPLYSDPALCEPRESPLECEFRRNNPSIVLVSFETWFYDRPIAAYETYMRQIIDTSIEAGVVPVLVTGADSHERSQEINAILGSLAIEYDIPLWNFWLAIQDLPNQGLEPAPDENGFQHLTYGDNNFADPVSMQTAWPVRNLTGLQMLDALWRAGNGISAPNGL